MSAEEAALHTAENISYSHPSEVIAVKKGRINLGINPANILSDSLRRNRDRMPDSLNARKICDERLKPNPTNFVHKNTHYIPNRSCTSHATAIKKERNDRGIDPSNILPGNSRRNRDRSLDCENARKINNERSKAVKKERIEFGIDPSNVLPENTRRNRDRSLNFWNATKINNETADRNLTSGIARTIHRKRNPKTEPTENEKKVDESRYT